MSQLKKRPFIFIILRRLQNAAILLSKGQNKDNSLPHDNPNLTEVREITSSNLKMERILIEEYRFRGTYLIQCLQDIHGTFNLYFLMFAIFVSGVGASYSFVANARNILQLLIIVLLIALGGGNFLFFIRFVTLVVIYLRNKACMNEIREYYIQHLQSQIPDISNAFRLSMDNTVSTLHRFILYSVLTFLSSICLAGAAFVSSELWLNINGGSFVLFPSDLSPYIIGLAVIIVVTFVHLIFYRLTEYRYSKRFGTIK